MSRVLRFPTGEPVGRVFLSNDPKKPIDASGDVEVPADAQAFLILNASAPRDLSFLADADDVLGGLRGPAVDVAAVSTLVRQKGLDQVSILSPLPDASFALIGQLDAVTNLELTLADEAGPGLASLAGLPLRALSLHGDPGSAFPAIAGIETLRALHFHTPELRVDYLAALGSSSALKALNIEVGTASSTLAPEVVDALASVSAGLEALAVKTRDGKAALPVAARIAVLSKNPDVKLDGTNYTPAAVVRLERKAARV